MWSCPDDLPPSAVKLSGDAVAIDVRCGRGRQSRPAARGLGDKGGDFNRVFVDTFERIVLAGQPVEAVLERPKAETAAQAIMEEHRCTVLGPDAPSEGACPVE